MREQSECGVFISREVTAFNTTQNQSCENKRTPNSKHWGLYQLSYTTSKEVEMGFEPMTTEVTVHFTTHN